MGNNAAHLFECVTRKHVQAKVEGYTELGPQHRAIQRNLPTRISNLHRSPRFLNQDIMDEPGPSTTGVSTSTTSTSQEEPTHQDQQSS
ncbi:hypothetical protein MKW98_006836 [Papaver atlanticum]|uniref:Uncharacterized protein n=1 Tax=Papaver atlanticum TaxID=357466 RepID=A0AAD4SSZ0_9MAGN|nr:hypothetical protein MKW98_006836 [Papaver atlanticum]